MNADSSDIHRLLDEAFAGVTMTPELQDLKEELRGNLAARSAELRAKGADGAVAARTAVAELGDIPELIASVSSADGAPVSAGAAAAEAARLHRVRPKPGFVIFVTLLSILVTAATLFIVLFAVHAVGDLGGAGLVAAVTFGLGVAALVDGGLRQETARHFRMPSDRAIGYGLAGGALAIGLGIGGLLLGRLFWSPQAFLLAPGVLVAPTAIFAIAAILVLGGIIAFIALGVTQTNRTKPWALAQNRQYEIEDGFSQNPAAAARFGLYTVVIWVLAIAAFVVLSIVVGFVWSWLALVAGFVIFFLVLARMLFPAGSGKKP